MNFYKKIIFLCKLHKFLSEIYALMKVEWDFFDDFWKKLLKFAFIYVKIIEVIYKWSKAE